MILNNLQGKVFCGGKEVSQIYHGTNPLWTGTVNVRATTKINIWFDNSGSMDTTLDDLVRMQSTNLKTTLLPFYNNDEEKYNSLVTVRNFTDVTFGMENSVYLGGADMVTAAAEDPPRNVINITFCDEESSPGTDFQTAEATLKTGLEANIGNAAIFNRVVNSGFGSRASIIYRARLETLRNKGGVFATQCDYNLDVVPNNGEAYYAGLIEASLLRLGLEKA
jgi:hypothetical protein